MANDGRVSSDILQTEFLPSDVGHVSSDLLFPEYALTNVGHVSSVLVFPEYLPTAIGHESSLLLMVEYAQGPSDAPLVQGEEQLQMTQFQGTELDPDPGQVT